ncbi:MAG TPA: hypothetical protein VLT33_21340 [Labilithrix sp.]|nr:hypothetical protein [Labilithrix sp.]
MRIRLFLALASISFVAAGFGIQACGGSSDDTVQATPDANVAETAAETGPKDAGGDAADAAPPCDTKRDFLADIPDASIADGASSTGVCVGCVKSKCNAEVAKCAGDCVCQSVAGNALDCYAKTQDILGCAGKLATVPKATQTIGIALFSCVQQSCKDECAASAFTDGGDGG